jgi:hypothetical protein
MKLLTGYNQCVGYPGRKQPCPALLDKPQRICCWCANARDGRWTFAEPLPSVLDPAFLAKGPDKGAKP